MQKDKDYANAILNDYTSSILAHIASLLGAMAWALPWKAQNFLDQCSKCSQGTIKPHGLPNMRAATVCYWGTAKCEFCQELQIWMNVKSAWLFVGSKTKQIPHMVL